MKILFKNYNLLSNRENKKNRIRKHKLEIYATFPSQKCFKNSGLCVLKYNNNEETHE